MERTNAQFRLQAAIDYAWVHHRNQWRKGTSMPYLFHPLQVMNRLAVWGIRLDDWEDTWIATVLHDAIEDTDATLREVEILFGIDVAKIVKELSFIPKGSNREEVAMQKAVYLKLFAVNSVDSLVIKIADRLCNTGDFIQTEERYAVGYWGRASALVQCVCDRMHEIQGTFGKSVGESIAFDIGVMTARLANVE